MEGYAALFVMVLPLLNAEGHPVFTGPLLQELFLLLDNRFGGCLVPSASTHPPYWGLWHPPGVSAVEAQKDLGNHHPDLRQPDRAKHAFFQAAQRNPQNGRQYRARRNPHLAIRLLPDLNARQQAWFAAVGDCMSRLRQLSGFLRLSFMKRQAIWLSVLKPCSEEGTVEPSLAKNVAASLSISQPDCEVPACKQILTGSPCASDLPVARVSSLG